ncbi:amidohydrolase [Homoserinibacter sp. YIM 151385]|uniref:amidohydrolase n=1 Tax=Homoserinibacter sp. YIM 151385 TaxID=2985506 RepID=UPI0022F09278|nr:amidohydrolase [Homoserinibacter sp. YIM 151385]WBU36724.1 amidohydrolase [Homoserinibacter sp. YIM 151385]
MTSTGPITVYRAKRVVTLDPARPVAEAVAVRGDRILAAGSLDELAYFDGTRIDDRYADDVVFPGFVEAHAHAMSGALWRSVYVGFHDRRDLSGRVWPGCRSIDDVIARLSEADARMSAAGDAATAPDALLFGWGLDPAFFPGERLAAKHLDLASATRPIFVLHGNAHVASVNSAMMRRHAIDRSVSVEGVERDALGEPNGELREIPAMSLASSGFSRVLDDLDVPTLRESAVEAVNAGTTTMVDLASSVMMTDAGIDIYRTAVESDEHPVRLAPFHFGVTPTPGMSLDQVVERLQLLSAESTAKLRLRGYVKLMLDGSIQSHTARLQEPGYLNHAENGMWTMSPEYFEEAFTAYHRAGMLMHVHCNGDEATELMLDTVERVLTRHPRPDHRHTVTHSQLSTAAQYRRMAALGLCANILPGHMRFWGEIHRTYSVGPDRAARMNAAATALREGVPISLHSDTPVTPLDPLATVSYAAERRTWADQPIGPGESITIEQGLRAVTIGAAHMLKMDAEVGSIEGGKRADFAILDRDPTEVVEPAELRDIAVRGTMLGGRAFSAASGA